MTKAVIYARYSTDLQNEASVEDQIRQCQELAARNSWRVKECYSDHAISAATLMRPGIQKLIQDVLQRGDVDVVIAEALDRISRDQEDIAGLFKRLEFAGIKLYTTSEGEISSLHIGMNGTMNALFLQELAKKTKRGIRGRIEKGKSGGGNSYGYKVVKHISEDGEVVRGDREIHEFEADVVRRIFRDYAKGISPKAITHKLNEEGIPAPNGKDWGPSTIHGNRKRGTGILNNEIYIGKLVWNKLTYKKDPDTGKRVSRMNPPEEWVSHDVPELRIIDQVLWDKVKDRQGEYVPQERNKFGTTKRPVNLFTYLIKCGQCGGGMSVQSKNKIGCSTARNKGTCSNKKLIAKEKLEDYVLHALQNHLMKEDLCDEFCKEYVEHMNRLIRDHNKAIAVYQKELEGVNKRIREIIDAVAQGFRNQSLKEELDTLEDRKEELNELLAYEPEANKSILHPSMIKHYRQEVKKLVKSLKDPEHRQEAADLIRSLIERIVLTPNEEAELGVSIDVQGDLAGILKMSLSEKEWKEMDRQILEQIQSLESKDEKTAVLVAGGGFEPPTFRL